MSQKPDFADAVCAIVSAIPKQKHEYKYYETQYGEAIEDCQTHETWCRRNPRELPHFSDLYQKINWLQCKLQDNRASYENPIFFNA